jgi:uncharacterized membrane protein YdjX (TVP38/TMEM64 family)
LVAVTLPAIGGFVLLAQLSPVGQWLQDQGAAGIWIYAAVFAVTSGFALLPTYAQAVLGGWAFGFAEGSMAAVGGVSGGAVIGYLIARRSAGQRVTTLIDERPKWKAVHDALLNSGAARRLLIVTLLRVPPNSPFAVTNLVMASTRVPLVTFVIGTIVGMAPRTAGVAYIGSGLESLAASSFKKGWTTTIISIGLTVVVVAIIGHISRKAVERVTGLVDDHDDGKDAQTREP